MNSYIGQITEQGSKHECLLQNLYLVFFTALSSNDPALIKGSS
jgi:hypothetical protein